MNALADPVVIICFSVSIAGILFLAFYAPPVVREWAADIRWKRRMKEAPKYWQDVMFTAFRAEEKIKNCRQD